MKDVTLKQRELARLHVLNNVLEYQIPIVQAAEILGMSERHTRRLLNAYRKDGAAALAHGNRGRRPHNAIPESQSSEVVKLASTHYAGTNHTHLTELLRDQEGIDLSRPTVRPHSSQSWHRQPAQPPPSTAQGTTPAYAPRGDALADRRQPPPVAG